MQLFISYDKFIRLVEPPGPLRTPRPSLPFRPGLSVRHLVDWFL